MSSRCEYSTATDDEIEFQELEDGGEVNDNLDYPGQDGEWSCPRQTEGEADYCLFHMSPRDRERSGSQVSQIIIDTFNESNSHELDDGASSWRTWDIVTERQTDGAGYRRERKQFIGAKLDDVTLQFEYAECDGDDHFPIDLRGATIQRINLWKANVVGGLRLQGATLGGWDSSKCGKLSGVKSTINGSLELDGITAGTFSLDDATISGNVELTNAQLTGAASFKKSEVEGDIDLRTTEIADEVVLDEAIVEGEVELYETTVQRLLCENASINVLRIFSTSSINGDASLSNSEFLCDLRIDSKAFEHPCIHSVDLSGSTIAAGELAAHDDLPPQNNNDSYSSGAPFIFELSESDIGDVNISPECNCESAASLEHAYICESILTGFPFKQAVNRSDLRATDWQVHSLVPGGHTIRGMRQEYKGESGAGKVAERIIDELQTNKDLQKDIINFKWHKVTNQYGKLYDGPSSDNLDRVFEAIQHEYQYQTAQPFGENVRSTPRPLLSRVTTNLEELPLEEFVVYPCHPNVSESGVYVCDQTALLDVLHLITKNIRWVQKGDEESAESNVQRWHQTLTTVIAHRFALELDNRPTPRELESTYLLAKNGANHEGDQMAAGEFFQMEKIWARRQYINGISETSSKDAYRYVSNMLLSAIAGYGERPQRVLRWSLVMIGVFSVFYWGTGNLLLGDQSNMTVVEAGIASFGSFVTLFLQPDSSFGANALKLSAQIEGFIGVFSISLFVYTLTRSVHR